VGGSNPVLAYFAPFVVKNIDVVLHLKKGNVAVHGRCINDE
jgi:hypothetical protein